MSIWDQAHNNTRTDQLTSVVNVSWSKPRCWHGETVTIYVRSSFVPNGGQVTLEIFASGDPTVVDTIAAQAYNNNTLDQVYTIDWKTKVVPAGAGDFVVRASLTKPVLVSPISDPLAVDLVPPVFSA